MLQLLQRIHQGEYSISVSWLFYTIIYSQEMEDEINEMTKKHCAIANKHQERLEVVCIYVMNIHVCSYVCCITKTIWL